ncbi:MAG: hypothetical protein CFE22_03390 [Cytophagaceae bacterium BCCC1]|nr:MAG: hypothetical protein CFE22_03390 [Cytophagaceae bacterium BCCC1]
MSKTTFIQKNRIRVKIFRIGFGGQKGESGVDFNFFGLSTKREITFLEKMQDYKTSGSKCPTSRIQFVKNAFY